MTCLEISPKEKKKKEGGGIRTPPIGTSCEKKHGNRAFHIRWSRGKGKKGGGKEGGMKMKTQPNLQTNSFRPRFLFRRGGPTREKGEEKGKKKGGPGVPKEELTVFFSMFCLRRPEGVA